MFALSVCYMTAALIPRYGQQRSKESEWLPKWFKVAAKITQKKSTRATELRLAKFTL